MQVGGELGIDCLIILPVRETRRLSSSYYSSLEIKLISYFGVNVSLYSVKSDGNCLYRALSHIILGNEEYYAELKSKLIEKFVACQNHHFNVM